MNMSLAEIFGICATVLGCTWHISGKITTLAVTLKMHQHEDEERFASMGRRLDEALAQVGAVARDHLLGRPNASNL
jgi:hypothetical protein